MIVKFQKLTEDAVVPKQAHPGDAGFDLVSVESATLLPNERKLIHTGLAMEVPEGYEGQVRPRSGLALKNGVTVLNAPGTIDAGYRGEIGVILINFGENPFTVEPGMRIAQLVIAPTASAIYDLEIQTAFALSDSERGSQGYGSSGVK